MTKNNMCSRHTMIHAAANKPKGAVALRNFIRSAAALFLHPETKSGMAIWNVRLYIKYAVIFRLQEDILPVGARRLPVKLLEKLGEMKRIRITDILADLTNGQIRPQQQICCTGQAEFR